VTCCRLLERRDTASSDWVELEFDCDGTARRITVSLGLAERIAEGNLKKDCHTEEELDQWDGH
jgi:hypothetical protein